MSRVRRATIDDAAGIAAVHVSSWRAGYRGLIAQAVLDALDVQQRSRQWRAWLAASEMDAFVIDSEGVQGFATLARSADTDAPARAGEIAAMYVAPDSWRMGMGRQLMRAVVERTRERRFDHLTLWVLRENARARRFYEAVGFSLDGAERTETQSSGPPLHDVRYTLTLGPA